MLHAGASFISPNAGVYTRVCVCGYASSFVRTKMGLVGAYCEIHCAIFLRLLLVLWLELSVALRLGMMITPVWAQMHHFSFVLLDGDHGGPH